MNETGIIWTEATWNPMSGCQKISQGCKFCYAHSLAEQKRGTAAFPNGFDLTIREHKLKEPFKLKQPTLIFANSMSDLFWDKLPNDYRHKIIDVIEQTPQHEYQVLTKRPEIMLEFSKQRKLPKNFWAGTTIEDNRVKFRLDILKQVETEIKFISAEPLIAPLTFDKGELDGLQWIITGGESGNHIWKKEIAEERALVFYDYQKKKWIVREDRAEWIRHIRDRAKESGLAFFHKQWGGNYPEAAGRELDGKFWTEIPRLPGQRKEIQNDYLNHIQQKKAGDKEVLLEKNLLF